MWTFWCWLRYESWLNIFPHSLHSKGFSLVWALWCWVSSGLQQKAFSHLLHLQGFSLVPDFFVKINSEVCLMVLWSSVSLQIIFPKWVSVIKSKFSVKCFSCIWHFLRSSSAIIPGSGKGADPSLLPLWAATVFFSAVSLWLRWLFGMFWSLNMLLFHFPNLPTLELHGPFSVSFFTMIFCGKSFSKTFSDSIASLVEEWVSKSEGKKKNKSNCFYFLSWGTLTKQDFKKSKNWAYSEHIVSLFEI